MKYFLLTLLFIASANCMQSKIVKQQIKNVKQSGMDSTSTPDHVKHSGQINCTIV